MSDRLMNDGSENVVADRIEFREGQSLTAADLNDTVAMLAADPRRHSATAHTAGVVLGLALTENATGRSATIEQGVAVDVFGRALVVPQQVEITDRHLSAVLGKDKAGGLIDISLVYRCTPVRGEPGRLREWAAISLKNADKRPPEPSCCGSIVAGTEEEERPVYLGRLNVTGTRTNVVDECLPWRSRLVGEQVESAARELSLRNGLATGEGVPSFALSDSNERVYLGYKNGQFTSSVGLSFGPADTNAPSAGTLPTVLRVGGAPEDPLARSLVFQHRIAKEGAARPWTIELVEIPPDPKTLPAQRQLRLSIDDPGASGNASRSMLAIGHGGAASPEFLPWLTVAADRVVTVGSIDQAYLMLKRNRPLLHVMGDVIQSPIKPDLSDPRFLKQLRDSISPAQPISALTVADTFTWKPDTKTLTFSVKNAHTDLVRLASVIVSFPEDHLPRNASHKLDETLPAGSEILNRIVDLSNEIQDTTVPDVVAIMVIASDSSGHTVFGSAKKSSG